jgi:ABC-type antimicrobial peptide transport system permease subunit
MNEKSRIVANAFEFFKSTVPINFGASLFVGFFGGLIAFNYSFLSFGFILSLLLKELRAKNEYLFYFNNRVSKKQLWMYSWFFSLLTLIVGIFIFNLIHRLF